MLLTNRLVAILPVCVLAGSVGVAGLLPWGDVVLTKRVLSQSVHDSRLPNIPFSTALQGESSTSPTLTQELPLEKRRALLRHAIKNRIFYAPYWLELAGVERISGNREEAEKLAEMTKSLWPNRSGILWHVALLQIRLGLVSEAIDTLSKHIESEPSRVIPVVDLISRIQPNPNEYIDALIDFDQSKGVSRDVILTRIIRHGLKSQNEALSIAALDKVGSLAVAASLADEVVDSLIRNSKYSNAKNVLLQYVNREEGSMLSNGDFERPLLKKPFEWRFRKLKNVSLSLDSATKSEGNSSLRIKFNDDKNLAYNHFSQLIAVEPNRKYRLAGHWKAVDLTSSSLPFIAIDLIGPSRSSQITIHPTNNSWHWSSFEKIVEIPTDVNFLSLGLKRIRAKGFDKFLTGTLWLDQITLEPLSPQ